MSLFLCGHFLLIYEKGSDLSPVNTSDIIIKVHRRMVMQKFYRHLC